MGILKLNVIKELIILVHYALYNYEHYYQITQNYLLFIIHLHF